MWKRLTHQNLVPLLGITVTRFQLISNRTSGGGLPEYIKENPNTDRLGLVGSSAVFYPTLTLLSAISCR